MEDVVNPAVPSTTGALLAEEWTINPLATLPSFLEMYMMDEASRSARKSLDAGLGLLQQKLAVQSRRATDNEQLSSISTSLSTSYLMVLLRRLSARIGSTMALVMDRFGPEISCLILYTLERHCLRSAAGATISESLYGGRQAKLGASSDDKQRKLLPLTDQDKTRLALCVAFGPYIRRRFLLWYQKLKQQQQSSQSSVSNGRMSLLQKLKKLLIWVYPLIHLSISSLDFWYQWRYMLGKSAFFRPSAHLLGLIVRRVTQEDTLKSKQKENNASIGKSQPNTPNSSGARSSGETSAGTSSMRNIAVWALSSAVVLSWASHFRAEFRRQRQELLLQQQQEQEQQGQHATNIRSSTQTPPPPANVIENALPAHLCPLCRQPRVHPTASSSGFVFCYRCLLQHVKEKGSCPVTGRTCKEAQLLRLYEPNHATTPP